MENEVYNCKKIILKNLGGILYYDFETTDNEHYDLFDQKQEFICSFYARTKEDLDNIISKIENIQHITELVDLGLCLNMIYNDNLKDLYYGFLAYFDYDMEEYTYTEFMENIPKNAYLDNDLNYVYFIVDLESI